ncbi:BON domain-containing protein [Geothrix sp. 21YS21S-4]|uniref:BON domain-containing protein n=1 Tax=Geothrix sp. 21YS21S-4 TaxID=3068889 RepID=UPI0035934656
MARNNDSTIESAIKNSYNYKTYLKDDDIKVEAKNGVVTLSGTPDAEHAAAGVDGPIRSIVSLAFGPVARTPARGSPRPLRASVTREWTPPIRDLHLPQGEHHEAHLPKSACPCGTDGRGDGASDGAEQRFDHRIRDQEFLQLQDLPQG